MIRKKGSTKPSKKGKRGPSNSRSKPKGANADTLNDESLPDSTENPSTSPGSLTPSSTSSIESLLEQSGLTEQEAYQQAETERIRRLMVKFRTDPVGYARDILGIELWQPIGEALEGLLVPPYRVSVDSGHGVGKTHGAAAAVNWWYDTRGPQCVCITTAPTQRDVIDLLWTEIRLQRMSARVLLSQDFIGPAAPEMKTGPEHYAKGYTARKGESFQGRHRPNMLFVFDEKEGIDGNYWTAAKTMFRPGSGDAWLVIGNPTTTTSVAYQEHRAVDPEGNPTWNRVRLSCLDHPNMRAVPGDADYISGAVTRSQVSQWIDDWCDPVAEGDEQETDIEWDGLLFRPGPIAEPRILGLRPSAGNWGVWSEAIWRLVVRPAPTVDQFALPVIGCDCANYGSDYTVFHVRCGTVSLYHYAVNGWGADRICGKLMDMTKEWAAWATKRRDRAAAPNNAGEIAIQIDDDATGRAICSWLTRQKLRCVPVNAGGSPIRPDLYKNVRSELWFMAARKAAKGLMNLSRLDRATLQRIEMQAMAPEWWPTPLGQREVESKDDLRKPERLGRSPDDMDSLNLAYYEPSGVADAKWVDLDPAPMPGRLQEKPAAEKMDQWYAEEEERVKLFGR